MEGLCARGPEPETELDRDGAALFPKERSLSLPPLSSCARFLSLSVRPLPLSHPLSLSLLVPRFLPSFSPLSPLFSNTLFPCFARQPTIVVAATAATAAAAATLQFARTTAQSSGAAASAVEPPPTATTVATTVDGHEAADGSGPRPRPRLPGRVTSSAVVDAELMRLLDLVFADFVDSWLPIVTQHPELRETLHALVMDLISAVERRIAAADLVEVVYKDAGFAVLQHIEDYVRCRNLVGTAHAGGLDIEALYLQMQPHPAMASPEAEQEYLRQIVAWTIHLLLPESERNSEVVQLFIREALTRTVLGTTLETVATPDFLYRAVYILFTPNDVLAAEAAAKAASDAQARAKGASSSKPAPPPPKAAAPGAFLGDRPHVVPPPLPC